MKRNHLAISLVLSIVALSSATKASAMLISLDDSTFGAGSFTKDTATGLEWLDISRTLNQSMDSIKAGSGIGGTYYGLRYATSDEVSNLYSDAGIYSATSNEARYYAIYDLLGLIGYAPDSYSNELYGSRIVYGITGTGPADQFGHYISTYLWAKNLDPGLVGYYNLGLEVDGSRFGSTSQGDFLGSFLVKDQQTTAVPEPSTLFLLGTGFACAGLSMRRMKR